MFFLGIWKGLTGLRRPSKMRTVSFILIAGCVCPRERTLSGASLCHRPFHFSVSSGFSMRAHVPCEFSKVSGPGFEPQLAVWSLGSRAQLVTTVLWGWPSGVLTVNQPRRASHQRSSVCGGWKPGLSLLLLNQDQRAGVPTFCQSVWIAACPPGDSSSCVHCCAAVTSRLLSEFSPCN